MFATVPVDWQLTDTYFVVAHFHYVLVGGIVFALFAATYYWFPKFSGRMLSERLGKWQFWLWVIGFNGTFGIQHALGLMGMPRRVYTYADNPGWALANAISSFSVIFMAAGTLVLVWNVIVSLRRGKIAGDNPWDGFTLEWATSSPPPTENFDKLPEIKGRRPVWDLNYPEYADWKTTKTPADSGLRPNAGVVSSWAFIVSEAIFFILLLVAYVVFNSSPENNGPNSQSVLEPVRVAVISSLLLLSSLTCWLAERALHRGNTKRFKQMVLATIGLGVAFLGGQIVEYVGLMRQGVTMQTNLFASTFFTVTGFHGFHVFAGLVALAIMLVVVQKGRVDSHRPGAFRGVALYWHFVDVVWLAVFSIVYLRALQ